MSYPPDTAALTEWLKLRDYEYWVNNTPTVDDIIYDAAVKHYKVLTKRDWDVLGRAPDQTSRILHVKPMLSLQKVTEIEGPASLVAWTPRLGKYVLSPKCDGLAGRIKYVNRKLAGIVSRGDGTYGESLLQGLRPIVGEHIPAYLAGAPTGDHFVDGEVYLPTALFSLVGGANPRNAAAGLVRRQSADPRQKHLRFVAYKTLAAPGEVGDDYLEQLQWMKAEGFEVMPHATIDSMDFAHLTIEGLRPEHWLSPDEVLPYEIDGVVIALNDLTAREELGETGHHPRWAVAIKFETKVAEATLLGVEWNASRTGPISATGIFTSVNLCGTVVTRATLHNLEHYQKLGATIGSRILIEKRGDIIPAIKGLAEGQKPTVNVSFPGVCPSCNQPTTIALPHLLCTNTECPAKLIYLIEHVCKRGNLDINGVGEQVAEAIANLPGVHNPYDFLRLEVGTLAGMSFGKGTFGTVRAVKVVENIKSAYKKPWNVVLHSLGCPGLGEPEADLIAAKFSLWDLTMLASPTQLKMELIAMEGVGEKTAVAFVEWLRTNRSWLVQINLKNEVTGGIISIMDTHPAKVETRAQPLLGYSIVLTGTFSTKSARTEYEKRLKALGCEVPGSVSAKTTYLVAGENVGIKKTDAATKCGVTVINEQALVELLKERE